ncbi:MAG: type IX secretion system membrane protein PorP/SprF [Chitinophagales bacterium]|nr:type IX secretion system membrane protein PorP/SprF [Chitinophagales bacterium]
MYHKAHHYSILIVLFVLLLTTHVLAQQSSLFSHYYWNEQFYNPAYVGSKDMLHIQALNRFQWVGMDGAPQTFNFAAHSPLKNDNIALGIHFYNDRIGALGTNGIVGQYAYRLKFKEDKYKLSLGIQTGAEYRNLKGSKLITDDGMPDAIDPSKFEKDWMWMFGAGAYFYGDNFSVGFGVPQLLPKSLFKNKLGRVEPEMQYFISGAYQWNINSTVKLLPTATLRIMHQEPTQLEVTATAILYDQFQLGIGGRTGKTMIFMGQYMHEFEKGIKRLNVGYSFDKSIGKVGTINKGSHEIFLSFDIPVPNQDKLYKSPRYF